MSVGDAMLAIHCLVGASIGIEYPVTSRHSQTRRSRCTQVARTGCHICRRGTRTPQQATSRRSRRTSSARRTCHPQVGRSTWLSDQTTITTYRLEMDKVACKACGTCACLPDLHLRRRCVDCRAGAGSSLPSRIANFICSYVCSPTCGTDSAQSQNVATFSCRERCC